MPPNTPGSARQRRRTALVTGGTGSLGFHTAQALLAHGGWDVIITGRTAPSTDAAVASLGDHATGVTLDLRSLSDVARIARGLPPLDAVVCNAGVHTTAGLTVTQDGLEETFAVNHLAHFLLVREVGATLRPRSRVVFVSSGTHDPARRTGFPPSRFTSAHDLAFPAEDPHQNPFDAGRRRYTASKLCAVLAAYEFARRVPREAATFTVFDPGQIPGTGIARDYPGIRRFAWRRILPALAILPWNDIHTPAAAAAGLVRCVVEPSLDGVTGRYVTIRGERRSSADSYDPRLAADLWDISCALTAAAIGAR